MNKLPVDFHQKKLNIESKKITKQEFEILNQLLSGLSIKEMAELIGITPAGIKFRINAIYKKFGCINRVELIKLSTLQGLQIKLKDTVYTYHNQITMRQHE